MNTEIAISAPPKTYNDGLKQIGNIQTSLQVHTVVGYWQIGSLISMMEANEGKYGKKIIPRVSSDLEKKGISAGDRILQDAHRFYKTYPDQKKVTDLVEKRIGWSHVRSICMLSDAKDRKNVVDKIQEEGLNAREAKVAVQAVLNKDIPKEPKGAQKTTEEENIIDAETTPTEVSAATPPAPELASSPAPVAEPVVKAPPREGTGGNDALAYFQGLEKSLKYVSESLGTVNDQVSKLDNYISIAKNEDLTEYDPYVEIADVRSPSVIKKAEEIEKLINGLQAGLKTARETLKNVSWFAED